MASNELMPGEQNILYDLASTWNQFVQLGNHRPDDLTDFRGAIHEAQRIIAVRSLRRARPDIWGPENWSSDGQTS